MTLNILESIDCCCLKPKTQTAEVIKELMLEDCQLILTNRNWLQPDYLKLYFELVDSGEAFDFIINTLRLKY